MKFLLILFLSVIGATLAKKADPHRSFPKSGHEGVNAVSRPTFKGNNLRTENNERKGGMASSLSGQTKLGPKKDVNVIFFPSFHGKVAYKHFRAENDSSLLLNDTDVVTNNETDAAVGVGASVNATLLDAFDNETTSGASNETASDFPSEEAGFNETTSEGFNETAPGAFNETTSEGFNETASGPFNETAYEGSNETASEGFSETASNIGNETTSASSNETATGISSDEAAGILGGSTPESAFETATTLLNETDVGVANETSEKGDTVVIIGADNVTQEEVIIYEADSTLVINTTDELFDKGFFSSSNNQPHKLVDVIFYPSFDGSVTYHHMRTENETDEIGDSEEAFVPVAKKVEVIFYPAFEGTVKYNHLRTGDSSSIEGEEVASSGSCKPSSDCYSDRDCGHGGKCSGIMIGKCDCSRCVSFTPCKGDYDCGGLRGACDMELEMCNCHKGFASNGHKNDYFISVCNVMDCDPDKDSCFGLPCHKGSCSCM